MKKIILFLCLLSLSLPAFADNTTYPANARYVIVDTHNVGLSTFLLDTKTGKTWVFLPGDKDRLPNWMQVNYDWYKQDNSFGGFTKKSPLQVAP